MGSLLTFEAVALAATAMTEALRGGLADGTHRWQFQRQGSLFIAGSALPAVEPATARSFFDGGYPRFLQELIDRSGVGTDGTSLANSILCSDGRRAAVHLTFLPADRNETPIVAQDLMTATERLNLGI